MNSAFKKPVWQSELVGLRGLACLMVVFGHASAAAPSLLFSDILCGIGGSHLFFLIAGYLAVGSLARRPGFWPFIGLRALRIAPLLWLAILMFGVVVPTVLKPLNLAVVWLEAPLAHAFYFYNINTYLLGDFIREPLSVSWFVAALMQMYGLLALATAFVPQRHWRALLWGGVALALASRMVLAIIDATNTQIYVHTLARLDCLAVGGLLHLRDPWLDRICKAPLKVLGIIATYFVLSLSLRYQAPQLAPTTAILDYTGLCLLMAIIAWQALHGSEATRRLARSNLLQAIGRASYPIFLVNLTVVHGVLLIVGNPAAWLGGVLGILTLGILATCLAYGVAWPFALFDQRLQKTIKRLVSSTQFETPAEPELEHRAQRQTEGTA